MEQPSRLKEMLSASSSFRAQERKVADYLLKNEGRIQSLSIADIARESGSSKATVVRFCKSLGFQGLKDFRVWYEAGKGYQYEELVEATTEASGSDVFSLIRRGTAKCVG
ncbi:MAG: MurR/RpiR family transcriptional regulator, partial [Spirochaetales bacterium]|nr:MurR/RpiR family transcriptional regulator [Candidatus Physcosoma equi]